MTHATISYYDGNVYLESDGNPIAIEIYYKGKISGSSSMPSGFLIFAKNGKIIIIRLEDKPFPEFLFKYSGALKIKRAMVYGATERVAASISWVDHRWRYMKDHKWDLATSSWEKYSAEDVVLGSKVASNAISKIKTKIITNNIKSTSGNLVLKNGTPYYGDVHFHSDGYFMTGSVLTKDSKRLYIKKGIRIKARRTRNNG